MPQRPQKDRGASGPWATTRAHNGPYARFRGLSWSRFRLPVSLCYRLFARTMFSISSYRAACMRPPGAIAWHRGFPFKPAKQTARYRCTGLRGCAHCPEFGPLRPARPSSARHRPLARRHEADFATAAQGKAGTTYPTSTRKGCILALTRYIILMKITLNDIRSPIPSWTPRNAAVRWFGVVTIREITFVIMSVLALTLLLLFA